MEVGMVRGAHDDGIDFVLHDVEHFPEITEPSHVGKQGVRLLGRARIVDVAKRHKILVA